MPIGFAVALLVLSAPESFAQRTKFESLRQCERQAAVQFRRHNPTFKHFMIDRSSVHEDKFADKIGIQFVSTIFYGKATLDSAFGPRLVRFICLHPGYGKEPIFVYTLPE
ncbi:MAG: hypothetical protein HY659_07360 [Rhizobiales bacterium]|nr:hypothetical protein [Hyphomicrobiales bacterium]